MKIRVLNGPNINRLGLREPHIYGSATYEDLILALQTKCDEINGSTPWGETAEKSLSIEVLQTNTEGQLIDWIHQTEAYDGLIINPGAYSHTSIAILDALLSVDKPAIEVHITNVHKREPFRHQLMTAKGAVGTICGLGIVGYTQALHFLYTTYGEKK